MRPYEVFRNIAPVFLVVALWVCLYYFFVAFFAALREDAARFWRC